MGFGLGEQTIKDLIAHVMQGGGDYHITRHAMYTALKNKLAAHDHAQKRCLSISGSNGLGQTLGLKASAYVAADYPDHDMSNLGFGDGEFDFCISDQVLEHVEGDPFAAVQESARVVKPGGFICHTTCFINEIHGVPKDFWRFTPDSLALLCGAADCEIITCDGWGNREAWALIDLGFRFTKIPNDPANPIHKLAIRNEPLWPIVVWVLAQKR